MSDTRDLPESAPAEGYTPKTSTVRAAFMVGHPYWATTGPQERQDEFDRWLAAHDEEVRAAWASQQPTAGSEYGDSAMHYPLPASAGRGSVGDLARRHGIQSSGTDIDVETGKRFAPDPVEHARTEVLGQLNAIEADYEDGHDLSTEQSSRLLVELRFALAAAQAATVERDELHEKVASLRAGVLNLTREEMVQRITAVGPVEWKAGRWLGKHDAAVRARGLAAAEQVSAEGVREVLFRETNYSPQSQCDRENVDRIARAIVAGVTR